MFRDKSYSAIDYQLLILVENKKYPCSTVNFHFNSQFPIFNFHLTVNFPSAGVYAISVGVYLIRKTPDQLFSFNRRMCLLILGKDTD